MPARRCAPRRSGSPWIIPETNAQLGADVKTLSGGMADVGIPQVLALGRPPACSCC